MQKKRKKVLHEEHKKGKFIRHFIFGAEDGLISTLGFLSGVAGAAFSHIFIVIAGVAEVFAAALSMGIGTYLSTKSQAELMKRNIDVEKEGIERTPRLVKKQVEMIYRSKGFKGGDLKKIVNTICSDKKLCLQEMTVAELGIVPGRFENPYKAAFVMFFTFFILALIPLSPYLFFENVGDALIVSIVLTVLALFIVGALKTRLTKKNWFKSGFEMLILGFVAAVVTYFIGEFIGGLY
ncbi:MAG: VIT1/CCC1 transporter family protein [Nanoarchaeota archaeon]